MRILTLFCFIASLLSLSSCASKKTVNPSDPPLMQNEGYLALVFDSLDKLRTLKVYGESPDTRNLHISSIPKGLSFYMFKVPKGKYCIRKFSTYNLEVTITQGGACIDVEAGKINYPGHILPRYGGTYFIQKLGSFSTLLKKQYPIICNDFLLSLCQQQYVNEDWKKMRLAMPGLSSLWEKRRSKKAPKTGTRIRGNTAVGTKELR